MLALAVLGIAVAAALWIWMSGFREAQAAERDGGTESVDPSREGQPGELRGDAAAPEPGEMPAAVDGRTPEARVEIALERRARVLKPKQLPTTCELCVGDAASGLPGEFVAGTASNPMVAAPRGLQLVRFDVDGTDHYRVVRLSRRSAGTTVPVRRGMSIAVRGRVVNEHKVPVVNADVWLAGAATRTDKHGWFETAVLPVGDGMPLVVRGRGYAALFRVLGRADCETLDLRPILLNRKSTELRVRLLGDGLSEADARFYLVPDKGRDTQWLQYPLFFPRIEPVKVEADGIARFRNLPRGVRVRVLAQHPDCGNVLSDVIKVDGVAVNCLVQGAPRPRLTGRVVDVDGEAVAGAYVTSRAGKRSLGVHAQGWMLPAIAYAPQGAVAMTGPLGAFDLPLEWSSKGSTVVTLEAPGMTGLAYEFRRGEKLETRFVLYPGGLSDRPRLEVRADASLPPFVDVVVRVGEATQLGPYAWETEMPFLLPMAQRALFDARVRVDGEEVRRQALLIDETATIDLAK